MPDQPTYTGNPNSHPPSSFSTNLSGTCLCGSILVTIKDDSLFDSPNGRGHLCHCANCRKVAGSYVSSNLAIEKEKVEIWDQKGTLKEYEDWATGSGKCVVRKFCGNCGPIASYAQASPDKVILKMGIFPRIPKPEAESFALHRHDWQGTHEGVAQFEIARGGKKLGE
ncbi:hypothetical protein K504DRAFT_381657 [Pleomassaria siparia CBS 279.74]|uniref:CENP-V/GFA domain-containing protein n=1 Tax=Pleomassaria siparia CBS 279.74 TaxID=1314801 RepID=A0A6G1K6W8_9PLEO|nr:hypothetical protein K504DRAFT_381657 [Pleomassaria siparia CBS 279.74]